MANTESGNEYFSKYQHDMLNATSYFGLSRFRIFRSKSGQYTAKSSRAIPKITFYLFVSNSLIKVLYIVYLLLFKFREMEFLDKITLALYFLVFGIMTLGYTFWLRKFPFYEILYSFWKVEEGIYLRLGSPKDLKAEVQNLQTKTVWIHLAITYVGCFCFLIQYYADPKYYTFMYAIVDGESPFLWILFGIHEFMFMQHAWILMTTCNIGITFHAVILEKFLAVMTDAADNLCAQVKKSDNCRPGKGNRNPLDVLAIGTGCNINSLLESYKYLMLITQQYNMFASYKTVFLHACGYCQFISDVFLAVQVLKLPGTTIMDIWFYIEDSLVSMYMIYRVYKFMSRVQILSKEFMRAAQLFTQFPNPERRRLGRSMRALSLISLKVGPCHVTPSTVMAAMDILSNYYICVALWK